MGKTVLVDFLFLIPCFDTLICDLYGLCFLLVGYTQDPSFR